MKAMGAPVDLFTEARVGALRGRKLLLRSSVAGGDPRARELALTDAFGLRLDAAEAVARVQALR